MNIFSSSYYNSKKKFSHFLQPPKFKATTERTKKKRHLVEVQREAVSHALKEKTDAVENARKRFDALEAQVHHRSIIELGVSMQPRKGPCKLEHSSPYGKKKSVVAHERTT